MHHHLYKSSKVIRNPGNSLWNRIESYTMKLRGRKKLLNLLSESKVDLILHGHYHEMKEYKKRDIKILNSSMSVEDENENLASAYIIDFEDSNIKVELKNFNLKTKIYNPKILD